ncbi:GNAT family N-acetyltransferase [Corallincola holothuriorum]|uniref:GNAT family N-acetyltransferase n=1 Tax=Corallincola holothuriorum TaxID=2282215 RepID=A0A368NFE8_9GAMM|nr:GNAT family N-acetyltransferase [Corallincola holothuriorum]RCU48830.1 GNAT family N-acetyltransferase [Corallincola holothuriorum]
MELTIRAYEPSDITAVTGMLSTPEVFPNTTRQPYNSVAMVTPLFANPDHTHLLAFSGSTLVAAGSLLTNPNPRRKHSAELALTVAPAWQGKGVGNHMMTVLLQQADRWLNLMRVELTVFTDNEAAIHLYKKHGFETEGVMRADAFKNGEYCDSYAMARLSPSLTND